MDALSVLKCVRCGERKPLRDYNRDGSRKRGFQYWCRGCQKAHHREHKTEYNEADRVKHRKDPRRRMLSGARTRARKKGLEFSLTLGDVDMPIRCPLLGILIEVGGDGFHSGSPTLDRKDPSRGYVPGNVWVISFRANLLKNNATVKELETLLNSLQYLSKVSK